jgi:hypothetical protein
MKKNIKKIVSSALIFSALLAFLPRPAHAIIWGESEYQAMFLKEGLEEMYQKMQDTLIATLKMNAIRTVQSRMMSIVGGGGIGGGQPQIVTNWQDTIYGSANQQATLVVRDYFSQTKSMAGGMGGQKIVAAGEKIYNTDPTSMTPTIDRYVKEGRVDRIFDKNYTPNPVQALNDLSKMRNYPDSYTMNAQGLYAINYGEKAGAESAKNIAYGGFKGSEKKNNTTGEESITMPGSMKRDIFSEIANMPTKMVTLARSIPEVVASLITQMLTQTINQGFSMMNQQINRAQSTIMSQTGGSVPQIQGLIQQGIR